MHADEHAGAMYMTMTMMRPGLFFQREGPGSEPGNSLLCPDEAACSVCGVLGMVQCRASLLHKQHKQMDPELNRVSTLEQSRRLALHAPWESAGNGTSPAGTTERNL